MNFSFIGIVISVFASLICTVTGVCSILAHNTSIGILNLFLASFNIAMTAWHWEQFKKDDK